jgi:hypothetical protein
MHNNTMKCNKTQSKWCINKHGASKIINTFETYYVAKLTSEFTSLEEPTDDSNTVIVLVSLTDGPDFTGSKRRIEPKDLTRKFRLSIVRSISWFLSTSGLLLAKSEKAVEFMIPTPQLPTVGAN